MRCLIGNTGQKRRHCVAEDNNPYPIRWSLSERWVAVIGSLELIAIRGSNQLAAIVGVVATVGTLQPCNVPKRRKDG